MAAWIVTGENHFHLELLLPMSSSVALLIAILGHLLERLIGPTDQEGHDRLQLSRSLPDRMMAGCPETVFLLCALLHNPIRTGQI